VAVEASVEVLSVDADGVRIRALGSCAGCQGCGGRCSLGLSRASFTLTDAMLLAQARPGARLRLRCEARDLRDRAWVGYGLPLLGLLGFAASAAALADLVGVPRDPAVALAAAAGTLLGLTVSKRCSSAGAGLRLLEVRPLVEPMLASGKSSPR
jgi:positive regulator of sigma E activity